MLSAQLNYHFYPLNMSQLYKEILDHIALCANWCSSPNWLFADCGQIYDVSDVVTRKPLIGILCGVITIIL